MSYSKEFLSFSSKEKDEICSKIKKILEQEDEVLFAYIFGSFLYSSNPRDIDVAVYITPPGSINKNDLIKLEAKIADKISKEIKISFDKIDTRILNFSPNYFFSNVFSQGKLLFTGDKNLLSEMIEKTSLESLKNELISLQSLGELSYQ